MSFPAPRGSIRGDMEKTMTDTIIIIAVGGDNWDVYVRTGETERFVGRVEAVDGDAAEDAARELTGLATAGVEL